MTKSASPEKAKNDRALRFYRDVLGLERLHYGMWLPDDELSMENLKAAQKRYEDFLIDSIPEGCSRVLDVGCGTGELCLQLKKRGFQVEGLSPDQNQKAVFAEKVNAPFHFSRFEDSSTCEGPYDAIIMSESAQYIPIEALFKKAKSLLKPGGYLLVCDYFVLDHNAGILSKSGHCYKRFLEVAKASAFKIVAQRDITPDISKTLDMARVWTDKILLGADILTEKFRTKNPRTSRFAMWLFRKKIKKAMDQRVLLDTERFCAVKKYEFFLFQAD